MKYLLLVFFLIATAEVKPDNNLLLIEQANAYYDEGEYLTAIEVYEAITENGYESAALYYNLGNAYFKINDMASAILNYERALKFAPYDGDILFNLEVANSRIVDKIEPVPVFFIFKWWNQLVNLRSVEQWAWISVSAFFLLLIMALLFLLSKIIWLKKVSFWFGIVFLFGFLVSFSLANHHYITMIHKTEGIVFTPTLTVKSSPRENSTDIFVIHQGAKVFITNQVGEWYEIRIADGSKGWIRENDFKKI